MTALVRQLDRRRLAACLSLGLAVLMAAAHALAEGPGTRIVATVYSEYPLDGGTDDGFRLPIIGGRAERQVTLRPRSHIDVVALLNLQTDSPLQVVSLGRTNNEGVAAGYIPATGRQEKVFAVAGYYRNASELTDVFSDGLAGQEWNIRLILPELIYDPEPPDAQDIKLVLEGPGADGVTSVFAVLDGMGKTDKETGMRARDVIVVPLGSIQRTALARSARLLQVPQVDLKEVRRAYKSLDEPRSAKIWVCNGTTKKCQSIDWPEPGKPINRQVTVNLKADPPAPIGPPPPPPPPPDRQIDITATLYHNQESGPPLAGVRFELISGADGKTVVSKGDTDAKGRVRLTGKVGESYVVRVAGDDYEPVPEVKEQMSLGPYESIKAILLRPANNLRTLSGHVRLGEGVDPDSLAKVKATVQIDQDKPTEIRIGRDGKFAHNLQHRIGQKVTVRFEHPACQTWEPPPFYRVPDNEMVVTLQRATHSLVLLLDRSQTMSRYGFEDLKRASIRLMGKAMRSDTWERVGFATHANGQVEFIVPPAAGGLDRDQEERARRRIMAVRPFGTTMTLDVLRNAPTLLGNKEPSDGQTRTAVVLITAEDLMLDQLDAEHEMVTQSLAALQKANIGLVVVEIHDGQGDKNAVLERLSTQTRGDYSTYWRQEIEKVELLEPAIAKVILGADADKRRPAPKPAPDEPDTRGAPDKPASHDPPQDEVSHGE